VGRESEYDGLTTGFIRHPENQYIYIFVVARCDGTSGTRSRKIKPVIYIVPARSFLSFRPRFFVPVGGGRRTITLLAFRTGVCCTFIPAMLTRSSYVTTRKHIPRRRSLLTVDGERNAPR